MINIFADHKPINGKSQNVFDFIEVIGSLHAQAIEIIEH